MGRSRGARLGAGRPAGVGCRPRLVRRLPELRAVDCDRDGGGHCGRRPPRSPARRDRACADCGAVSRRDRGRRPGCVLASPRDARGAGHVACSPDPPRHDERALVDDLPIPSRRRRGVARVSSVDRGSLRVRSERAFGVCRASLRRHRLRACRRLDPGPRRRPGRRAPELSPHPSRDRSRRHELRGRVTGLGHDLRDRSARRSNRASFRNGRRFGTDQCNTASPMASDATFATQLTSNAGAASARPPRQTRTASR